MHLRGNIEGYLGVSSKDKWLSLHTGKHWELFYLPRYVAAQKRFFNRFLRDEPNGWDAEPRVKIVVRDPRGEKLRTGNEFPLPATKPVRHYLDIKTNSLVSTNPVKSSEVAYDALGPGVDFSTEPFAEDVEFTGFVSAHLWVKSSSNDMDIFATLRAFDPDGKEFVLDGAHEKVPVTRGWLRLSHRKTDQDRSNSSRMFHAHDEIQKVVPGEPYEVTVEIWPTSMVFPKGYRLVLTLMGKDFEFPGIPGRILHNHPHDRDRDEFKGTHVIISGGVHESWLEMPFVPGV